MALDETNKEIHELETSALIELFELDTSNIGGTQNYYFHGGTNGIGGDIIWGPNDITYIATPISIDGFEIDGTGGMPRPNMIVSNVGGVFSALLRETDDLIGATITRKRTFAKFLNAANFPEGINPTEDKFQEFPVDIFVIEQKKSENPHYIEFELASVLDTENVELPNRQIHPNFCGVSYRGPDCGYAGIPVSDKNGTEFFPDKGIWAAGTYNKWEKVFNEDKQWIANKPNSAGTPGISGDWTNVLTYSKGTWVSGTTYAEKEYVYERKNGVVYVFVSKVGSNQGNAPPNTVWWDMDICNKKLEGCKLRFGEKGPFPAAFFPGTARYF